MARNDNNDFNSKKHNIFAHGTKIVGNIISDGDIRIDGEIDGDIKANGRIVLGKGCHVNGTITCPNAEILGNFTGKLIISETLAIRDTAVIKGEISVKKLSIDVNAIFDGTCSMIQSNEKVKEGDTLQKEESLK